MIKGTLGDAACRYNDGTVNKAVQLLLTPDTVMAECKRKNKKKTQNKTESESRRRAFHTKNVSDEQFLRKLINFQISQRNKSQFTREIKTMAADTLEFVEKREEFWQQITM